MQPDVEVVGACADGASAVETIEREQPDLVFLDVQMPGMDGFEVVENLDRDHVPAIVFVTAHDAHAIRAFEIHALDFLLKPFDQTRFEKALERARAQLHDRASTIDSRLVSLLEELRDERKYPERLIVKSSGRVFFVRSEDIDWVEAAGNYVKIHTKNEGAPASREHEEHGSEARPQDLRAHPSLGDREHRPHQGARAVVPRRVRRDPARRNAAHGEPSVQRPVERRDRLIDQAAARRGRTTDSSASRRSGSTKSKPFASS